MASSARRGALRAGGRQQRSLQAFACLLHRADEVVPREQLFDLVRAGPPTVDHVLANAGWARRAGHRLELSRARRPRIVTALALLIDLGTSLRQFRRARTARDDAPHQDGNRHRDQTALSMRTFLAPVSWVASALLAPGSVRARQVYVFKYLFL